ncbi:hypothetical protein JTB14_004651 [Gonioctena quinquepunctata]|nr:hypothetical protein JTB14_004651 [Gonioctena quinquepunctata]
MARRIWDIHIIERSGERLRERILHQQRQTYPKLHQRLRPSKLTRASLENVSINPWGACTDEQSSLRRSRSLAFSRDNLFSSLELDVDGRGGRRRSQLIPRAKLIDRSSIRENRFKGSSVENLQKFESSRTRRHSTLIPPDYSPPESCYTGRQRQRQKKNQGNLFLRISPEPSGKHETIRRVSYEDLPELSLPNYYPDARYDTDNTDNISLTDNISSISPGNSSKTKYPFELRWEKSEQYESIPYDENIILSTNKTLYESLDNKPRTIRNPTPYHEKYGEINPNSLKTTDELPDEKSPEETDSNLDEINLNNEHYNKIPDKEYLSISEIEESVRIPEQTTNKNSAEEETSNAENNNPPKTLIDVPAGSQESEEYKTVVSVEAPAPEIQENNEDKNNSEQTAKEFKSHSHNYLREFLETQKGSRKPLQNFLSKKFTNLTRKTAKDPTNLKENRFHSLPDITASKNLRKCEKIDRKLRKCEQSNHPVSSQETSNRFIVNIGRHFDITANNSTPIDFEVKISKVPKEINKHVDDLRSDEQFLAAVKNLKETLHGSQVSLDENENILKPDVASLNSKESDYQNDKEHSEMALLYCQDECSKEFHEKLGTMRNYWNKMVGSESSVTNNDPNHAICDEAEIKSRVEDAKKKFEMPEEKKEEKPQNKVQLTKQLFEPKPTVEKTGKISPIIKETCNYFENSTSKSFYENDRSFESLCPTSVEIIDAKNNKIDKKNVDIQQKTHKSLKKSISVCTKPEFDHVRYKLVKSDMFQKKIFANCDKDSQFEGLMQYLQDYSFQELLDNNIIIIEPIRSKVPYEPSSCVKSMKNVTSMVHKNHKEESDNKSTLNRHFFYHPIRVNKEVNDDELPNPDTVRQVRQFFEGGVKKSESVLDSNTTTKENTLSNIDPDKDRCSATDSNSHMSNMSDFGSQENLYDSIDNEIYCEYVSEDILEKIREHGTTVTYYGGRVVDQKAGQHVLTKTIMDEIRNNENMCKDCNNCQSNGEEKNDEGEKENGKKESYRGIKFRILKSNSCSSRLELVGKENMQETKKKFISQHQKLTKQMNSRKKDNAIEEVNIEKETDHEDKFNEKNAINESKEADSQR